MLVHAATTVCSCYDLPFLQRSKSSGDGTYAELAVGRVASPLLPATIKYVLMLSSFKMEASSYLVVKQLKAFMSGLMSHQFNRAFCLQSQDQQ